MTRALTPDDWRRLEPLLDRVLDASPDAREAVIDEITGGDALWRAELVGLVEECELGLPLMDQPAAERFAALLEHPPVRFPAALGARYRMIREVGRGGMATVFLARDEKHARDVAVKIMRPELAATLGRERFLREIGIAAKLRHPNIEPLFDSGEADGALYYVMPYEEGHSLRGRLAREGRLGVEETLLILRDICDALAYAHQRGIVHRDIKPDNVLLAGRRAVVTDFGVARALSAAAGEPGLTTVGGLVGTPAYMAPEQVSTGVRLDPRLDVYSIGVMAFEMLTGERPFGLDSFPSGVAASADAVRHGLVRARPDVPTRLADLIGRCLAGRPEDRYPNAGELATALEEVGAPPHRWGVVPGRRGWGRAVVVGGVVVAAAGLVWSARQPGGLRAGRGGAPAPPAAAVAVLVFQHGSDPPLEPLALGLTDRLIGALGEAGLEVRSLQAVMPYRDSIIAPDALGRRLDASWLVHGLIYRGEGGRTVVSAQFTDARTGRMIDRREIDSAPGEDARLVEAAVTQVATTLRARLGDQEQMRRWRKGTRSDVALSAMDRASRQRRDSNRLAELRDVPGAWLGLRRADAMLDSAARADPRWVEPALQRAGLALNIARMLYGSGHAVDSVPMVLQGGIGHAEAALRLEPDNARAKETLGLLLYQAVRITADPDSAAAWRERSERMMREASEADPTRVDALTVLGTLHFARGEYERAYVAAEKAYRADAYHGDPEVVLSDLFRHAFEAGEDAAARDWCASYASRLPGDWYSSYCRLFLMVWTATETPDTGIALTLVAQGAEAAERVIRPVVEAQLRTLAAGVLARAGATAQARRMLDEVRTAIAADPDIVREPHGSVLREIEAGVRLRLGEREAASLLLSELLERHPGDRARLSRSRRFRGVSFDSLSVSAALPR